MNKNIKSHRLIATFFLLIFFPTIFPTKLLASNNGPVAPEATSFEPVDATDMVNLATGDMSYVLPLMNVPSPEGGYPLNLSYHAGIAMDQEASWVGLGWTLNPGAINRSVNGSPDDWDKTKVTDLLYDQGETIDQYDFAIGGTLANGVTLGMSKSWGAYKSWGGVVGYGTKDAGFMMNFGSDYNSFSARYGNITYSMDDINGSSIGLTYATPVGSVSTKASYTGEGAVGLNSVGVSFNSNQYNLLKGMGSTGSRIESNSTTAGEGDYYQNMTKKGFDFDVSFFWAKYQHTRFKYSLFLLNRNYVSGTLNLFDSKKENNYIQNNKYYMDVKNYSYYKTIFGQSIHPIVREIEITYPNYDNYFVSSQGISGSFSPKIFNEVLLYSRGSQKLVHEINPRNVNDSDMLSLTTPYTSEDDTYRLNNKIYFYFDHVNSSFLRTQKGHFESLNSSVNITPNDYSGSNNPYKPFLGDEPQLVNNIVTQQDATYTSNYTDDGELKKIGNRKRDGNYIEAFTNEDIVNSPIAGFLEVPGYNRANYNTLAPKGIGAYRITALDGKVYHYSLPVYNFEEYYKNYSNVANQNDKFLETIKDKPYATHWLLTAVTGPDYVDINNNGAVDEADYGYWVQFDYGKWTDGYAWRTPKSGSKEHDEKYLYSWGRKEIYYLDKVKTRTHSALFVKSLRTDDKSALIEYGAKDQAGQLLPYTSGIMPRNLTEYFGAKLASPIEQGSYYMQNPNQWINYNYDINYKHYTYKYVNIPVNSTLKLDKVILLKNSDANAIQKDDGGPSHFNRIKGYTYLDFGFFIPNSTLDNSHLRKDPFNVKVSNIHMDQNVIDNYDISDNYSTLMTKAVRVVNMNYDYSLGSNFPNASSGRLALKSVQFAGKGNVASLPPYVFKYLGSLKPYNFTNTDNWGYVKNDTKAWSLNQIITPIGSRIILEYEQDSFKHEVVKYLYNNSYQYSFSSNGSSSPITSYSVSSNQMVINFNPSHYTSLMDLNTIFYVNSELKVDYTSKKKLGVNYGVFYDEEIIYKIINVDNANKKITLEIQNPEDLVLQNQILNRPACYYPCQNTGWCGAGNIGESCKYYFTFSAIVYHPKDGGGLRVKKVIVNNPTTDKSIETVYDYIDPTTNLISGTTSFEPSDEEQDLNYYGIEELPSPEVLYSCVTVTTKSANQFLTKNIYRFNTFDNLQISPTPNDSGIQTVMGEKNILYNRDFYKMTIDNYISNNMYFNKIRILDRLSGVGRLKSTETFNSIGQKLTSTSYKYKDFNSDSRDQGVIQESFKYIKRANKFMNQWDANGNALPIAANPHYAFYSISKITVPNVVESVTTNDGVYNNTVYYDRFDFLTGQVTDTRTELGDGKSSKSTLTPAYRRYSEMGSKVDGSGNKNMLLQTAVERSYIRNNSSSVWWQTGVGITTWNNVWSYRNIQGNIQSPSSEREKIWRKHKSYTWNGIVDSDGIFLNYDAGSGDDGFNWVGIGSQPAQWRQISEVSLYDRFSRPLEMKDVNNNRISTKMGNNETEVIVSGNAGYSEIFYAGMENLTTIALSRYLEPQIQMNTLGTSRTTTYKHTGNYSVGATSSGFIKFLLNGDHRPGRYKLSAWVHKTNEAKARVKIGTATSVPFNGERYVAGDWVLKTHYPIIELQTMDVVLTSSDATTVYYDDIMLRPVASSLSGYVYNEWGELTHIVGNNGLATRYEYDSAGRLIKTYVEMIDAQTIGGFKLIKENKINYKNL